MWARREGDWIEIDVRDLGPGIAENDAMRVFEMFYSGGRSDHGDAGKTGTGYKAQNKGYPYAGLNGQPNCATGGGAQDNGQQQWNLSTVVSVDCRYTVTAESAASTCTAATRSSDAQQQCLHCPATAEV